MRLWLFYRSHSGAPGVRKFKSLAPLFWLLPILVSCSKDSDVPICQHDQIQINSNISIHATDTSHLIAMEKLPEINNPVISTVFWFSHQPLHNLKEVLESLSFSRLPFETGTYNLVDTNQVGKVFTSYGHIIDRDQAGYVHELMDDCDNYLEIISLDTLNHHIHARFEAHFRRIYEGTWTYDFPEEVHFTDCEFCLEYEEL